jgi:hypothetical protein
VPPQEWQRRLLFVKDPDPLGPNYFLLRDSFQATLPTQWNLWCLSEDLKIEGDHAHFAGRFGVDLELFLLTPHDKLVTGAWGPEKPLERQRLVQQWRAANQPYAALLYPRAKDEPMPIVRSCADGVGACLQWSKRTDYVFVDDGSQVRRDEQLEFQGQAAWVQSGATETRLDLVCGTRLRWRGLRLEQSLAADARLSARFAADGQISGECDGPARQITIGASGEHRGKRTVAIDGQPATLVSEEAETCVFEVPAGAHRIELR